MTTSFNPRAHTGRDSRNWLIVTELPVSIHAPTRGATAAERLGLATHEVSIHAPTRGATQATGGQQDFAKSFNPRAHTGRDLATSQAPRTHRGFNPRAHTGRDTATRKQLPRFWQFQSTRPHGARHRIFLELQQHMVSIHAPTRGATRNILSNSLLSSVSIHAPTRGATCYLIAVSCTSIGFNPRAHTGRDSIFSKRLNICIQNYTFCETWQTYTQNCFY